MPERRTARASLHIRARSAAQPSVRQVLKFDARRRCRSARTAKPSHRVRSDAPHPACRTQQQNLPRVDPVSKTARPERMVPAAGLRARAECSTPCCRRTAGSRRQSRARLPRGDSPADGPHPFAQAPREKQLAIDAQLDLVVAAGKELDRLRLGHVEKSTPARAEILAGQAGCSSRNPRLISDVARIDRHAAETRLREDRAGQPGRGRKPFDNRRERRHERRQSRRRWQCR